MHFQRYLALFCLLAVAPLASFAYTSADIDGTWVNVCQPCGNFRQCTISVTYVSANEEYVQNGVCIDQFGFELGAGQSGKYYIDGTFLGRQLEDFSPRQDKNGLLNPPPAGVYDIIGLTGTQLTLKGRLDGQQYVYTRQGAAPVGGGANVIDPGNNNGNLVDPGLVNDVNNNADGFNDPNGDLGLGDAGDKAGLDWGNLDIADLAKLGLNPDDLQNLDRTDLERMAEQLGLASAATTSAGGSKITLIFSILIGIGGMMMSW